MKISIQNKSFIHFQSDIKHNDKLLIMLFEGFYLLITGKFLNHHSVHPYRTGEVLVNEAVKALVSVDGRLIRMPVGPYKINVEQEVINFLIPE